MHPTAVNIRPVEEGDTAEWIRMRLALWPDSGEAHALEVARYFSESSEHAITFVAEQPGGDLCGFLEAGTRPYAEGCRSSPVAYIEGWWVDAGCRRQRTGTQLVLAAEEWARSIGMTEIASDADIANTVSAAAHAALGFAEVERLICYRKPL